MNQWWIDKRVLPDGRVAYIHAMTFGKFRISISPNAEAQWFDNSW